MKAKIRLGPDSLKTTRPDFVSRKVFVRKRGLSLDPLSIRFPKTLFYAAIASVATLIGGTPISAQNAPQKAPYLDSSQPIDVRVADLMKRMTLKEKIGQLNLPCGYVDALGKTSEEKMEAAKKFAAGDYTPEIGPGAGFFTLADTIKLSDVPRQVQFFNELQKIAVTKTRLKIPLLGMRKGLMVRCSPAQLCFRKGCQLAAPLICRW